MSIEITARHMHATEEIQEYSRRKGQFLVDEFHAVEHVHVVLDHVRHQGVAEVIVQATHHLRMEAKETGDNLTGCIDAAFDKVERQLRRAFDKLHDHKTAMKKAMTRTEDRAKT